MNDIVILELSELTEHITKRLTFYRRLGCVSISSILIYAAIKDEVNWFTLCGSLGTFSFVLGTTISYLDTFSKVNDIIDKCRKLKK